MHTLQSKLWKPSALRFVLSTAVLTAGCGAAEEKPPAQSDNPSTAAGGAQAPSAWAGPPASDTSDSTASGTGGSTAAPPTAGSTSTAGAAGASNAPTGSGTPVGPVDPSQLPASCAEAADAYSVSATSLDASLVPKMASRSWAGNLLQAQVAVQPDTNLVYVGFNRTEGDSNTAVIAAEGSAPDAIFSAPGAVLGGVAATSDGVGALLFDPNPDTDMRVWAAVARFADDRSMRFMTDLFRSPNLEDEGTKGAPTSGRLGYIAGDDQLVAYFGHTQRYDDGVRHQGGYLATLDAAGTQQLINGWWGSHNLDQRLLIDDGRALVLGIGDAYPEGIFYSPVQMRPRTNVLYPLASAGNGTTNGQLGGMVPSGDFLVLPFITNRSVPQDLDAGMWPDIDETIAMQIRMAAANGTDLGFLSLGKSAMPATLEPTWLDPQLTMGARLTNLKSARYGKGELILLLWAEAMGSGRSAAAPTYFTMVIDRSGAVCQPKTPLDAAFGIAQGDDIVSRPDGAIVWGNTIGGRVQVVTLVP
jgi:hypothetical protein